MTPPLELRLRDWNNERAATHLGRLGVRPEVIERLEAWAAADGMTLREQVRYVLAEYAPPPEADEGQA